MGSNNSPSYRRSHERWLMKHLERAQNHEHYGEYVSVGEWCAQNGWPDIVKLQRLLSNATKSIHAAHCKPYYKKPHPLFIAVNAYDPQHIAEAAALIRDTAYGAKKLKFGKKPKRRKDFDFLKYSTEILE